jgi:hypothetical protein
MCDAIQLYIVDFFKTKLMMDINYTEHIHNPNYI